MEDKKVKLVINAQILDVINRAIYGKNFKPTKFKEIYLDINNTKEEFIKAFSNSYSFELGDEKVCFTIDRSDEEIREQIESNKNYFDSQITSLKRTCERSEEYKEQIHKYIEVKGLYWLKELIKNKTTI